jgi:hypothetical protein
MTSRAATISLSLALLVSTGISWWLTDHTKGDSWFTFWSIVGANASVLGVVYLLVQLHQIRKEAEVIAATGTETRQKILDFTHVGDLALATKLIQDVQGCARASKHEIALIRLQEAKIIIGQLKATRSGAMSGIDYSQIIQRLNFLISSFEKEIETKTNTLQVARTNADLETIIDALVGVRSQIVNKR